MGDLVANRPVVVNFVDFVLEVLDLHLHHGEVLGLVLPETQNLNLFILGRGMVTPAPGGRPEVLSGPLDLLQLFEPVGLVEV